MKKIIATTLLICSPVFAIEQITDRNIVEKVVNPKKPAIVELYASWCAPCKKAAPMFEEAEKELKGKVAIFRLDVDESPKVGSTARVIPTAFFFVDGKAIAAVEGCPPDANAIVKVAKKLFKLEDK